MYCASQYTAHTYQNWANSSPMMQSSDPGLAHSVTFTGMALMLSFKQRLTKLCHITLGPHDAGFWAKHPSLTLPAPSRGEPSRHLGSNYQQGVSILSPLIANLSGLWGTSMQVMHGCPRDHFQDHKEASGILKIIKS